MDLIITEKPSVAKMIADVLYAKEKKEGYYQGTDYMVSWCIGHLVEFAPAHQYNEGYAKWKYEDLPISPAQWQYVVSEKTQKQFSVLQKLMNDKRVETVICATDAGREGELIFRLVYEKCRCGKPVKRLWISSLEASAIRNGFNKLKDGQEYDRLYKAALCRAQADWLVGINATRLFSLMYNQKLNVGRVITPTLALIVNREATIASFHSESFYNVQIGKGFLAKTERIDTREEAEKICAACDQQTAIVKKIVQKSKTEKPPKLYDLTTLQRDANRIYGYTAQQTLDYAQSLYEKKLITYPRTDSCYLTSDMAGELSTLVKLTMNELYIGKDPDAMVHIDQVIDDRKVTDHHALIPTQAILRADVESLPMGERDILNLIAVRLACAVGDAHVYEETTVTLDCAGYTFTVTGSVVQNMGWQKPQTSLFIRDGNRIMQKTEQLRMLPEMEEGQRIPSVLAVVKKGKTTPPKHFTEDTLLSAMETASAEDMPKDAERKGLGTPATRAGVIEKLVNVGLIQRKAENKVKHLLPTAKGTSLIAVLPEALRSAQMTAEWEQRLKRIERGEVDAEDFLYDINTMLGTLVNTAQPVPNADILFPSDRTKLGNCPKCGAPVSETAKGFFCENLKCYFGLWKDNRFLVSKGRPPTAQMMMTLLRDGQIHLTGLYSEKTKKEYNAILVMETEEDGSPRIRLVFN